VDAPVTGDSPLAAAAAAAALAAPAPVFFFFFLFFDEEAGARVKISTPVSVILYHQSAFGRHLIANLTSNTDRRVSSN
jgi:hypothetical protein